MMMISVDMKKTMMIVNYSIYYHLDDNDDRRSMEKIIKTVNDDDDGVEMMLMLMLIMMIMIMKMVMIVMVKDGAKNIIDDNLVMLR